MRFLIFILLLFQSTLSLAQQSYQISHYTTDNGLPSNGIKGMQWDSTSGLLWIATEAVLVRFNGVSFKVFNTQTNPEFGSDRIILLLKNNAGNILVAVESGNFSIIDKNDVHPFFYGSAEAKNNYAHFYGAVASKKMFAHIYKNPIPIELNFISNQLISESDSVCFFHHEDTLYRISLYSKIPYKFLNIATGIKKIFTIGKHIYVFSKTNKLFKLQNKILQEIILKDEFANRFNTNIPSLEFFAEANQLNPIIIHKNRAWIVEENKPGNYVARLIANNIPENVKYKFVFYNQQAQNLFLGSESKGVYSIKEKILIAKKDTINTATATSSYYSQIELPNGNILTSTGNIIGDHLSRNTYNIKTPFLNSVYKIADSSIFYSSEDSFYSYNLSTYQNTLLFQEPTNKSFGFSQGPSGNYFVTYLGIAKLNANNQPEYRYRFNNSSYQFIITSANEFEKGKLLIGSCNWLFEYDIARNKLDTLLNFGTACVRDIFKYKDYLFIGTYGAGFYIKKGKKIYAAPLDAQQYLSFTHCFVNDSSGYLWLSSNRGLFKSKIDDLINAFETNASKVFYYHYGKNDGMLTTEMNGGCTPCAITLKNGETSFPTMDGLLSFDPKKMEHPFLKESFIFLDEILFDDKQVNDTSKSIFTVPENVEKISLRLLSDAWENNDATLFEYKINNGTWQKIDIIADQPQITLSNLSYGDYSISIRKLKGFGLDNYATLTIQLHILTPFYHKWWFRIVAAIGLVLIIWGIFKIRLYQYAQKEQKLSLLVQEKVADLKQINLQLEKSNSIKTRLISIINHDLITPLRFLHYSSEALITNKKEITENEKEETIQEIATTAKEMEMLSSQILNWIIYQNPNAYMQKESFDLHELCGHLIRILQFKGKASNTEMINLVPKNFLIIQHKDPIRVLLYNLILNSLNFTQAGSVTIDAKLEENIIAIIIKDTGTGMSKEHIQNLLAGEKIISTQNLSNKKGTGLGYLIIKDLLNIIGGKMHIESSPGSGTSVYLYFNN